MTRLTTAHKFRRFLRYSIEHWPSLITISLLTVVLSAFSALQPLSLKVAVDYGIGRQPPPSGLAWWLQTVNASPTPETLILLAGIASLALYLVSAPLDGLRTWLKTRVGLRMTYTLAGDTFEESLNLSQVFHSTRSIGDSVTRIGNDSWCAQTIAENILISPPQHITTIFTIAIIAWRLDEQLTIAVLGISPLLAFASTRLGRRIKQQERKKVESKAQITSFVHNLLSALPVIQVFNAGERNTKTFRELAARSEAAISSAAATRGLYDLTGGVFITFGTCLVLWLGGMRVLKGEMHIGSLLVFISYVKTLEKSMRGLLRSNAELRTTESKVDRLLELFTTEERIVSCSGSQVLPALKNGERGHLVFKNVTFGYKPGLPVIRDFCLEVRPGETVALVGKSGSGKSTIASLALRLMDPWEGDILLDGIDLREIYLPNLREETSIVLQDPFLLPVSIADNISYGSRSIARSRIVAAAKAANAHEFISCLPDRYETIIGESGTTLSGGQRQRLAIARGMLKDSRLLVLDEPTSAIDAKTERTVLQALYRLIAGRSSLIIAHRLSTIRRADRIAVIDDGAVTEQGSYSELVDSEGIFSRFHQLDAASRED